MAYLKNNFDFYDRMMNMSKWISTVITKQFHKIVMKRLRISNASDEVAVLFGRDGDSGRWGIGVEHMTFLIFQRILNGCVQKRRLRTFLKKEIILAKANLPKFFFLKLVNFLAQTKYKKEMQKGKKEVSAARQLNKYSFMLEKRGKLLRRDCCTLFFFKIKRRK